MEKTRLSRDMIAARITYEFQDGWIANLGVGMPTMCSDFLPHDKFIILHSENGLIGYGRAATVEEATPYVVNAGVQPVLLQPYTAIVHHSDAFGVIRSGRLDVGVLGAYEVATNGDFANWRNGTSPGGGIGGAMDIAACAQRIYIMMEHQTRDGRSRLLNQLHAAGHGAGRRQAGDDRPRSLRAGRRPLHPQGVRTRLHAGGHPGRHGSQSRRGA